MHQKTVCILHFSIGVNNTQFGLQRSEMYAHRKVTINAESIDRPLKHTQLVMAQYTAHNLRLQPIYSSTEPPNAHVY